MRNWTENKLSMLEDIINREPLIQDILRQLSDGLATDLYYHSELHTRGVMRHTWNLVNADDLPERDKLLLSIAAAYHDAGFLIRRENNESIGAEMASSAMSNSGRFTSEEQHLVAQMILDTKFMRDGPAQISQTRLSPWLLDADLSNIGSENFWESTRLLALELNLNFNEMLPITHDLMTRHAWLSPAGKRVYKAGKTQNLLSLNEKLRSIQ